jgi:hypothetical protein
MTSECLKFARSIAQFLFCVKGPSGDLPGTDSAFSLRAEKRCHFTVPQTMRTPETAMWFCDMRQMPRLGDCVRELASGILEWFRALFVLRGARTARRSASR